MNQHCRTLTLAVVLLTPAALAQDAGRTGQVLEKLNETATEQSIFDFVGFQVSGDIVILSGFTIQPALRTDAEKAVREIDWVRHVVNRIEELSVEPSGSRLRGRAEEVLKRAVPQAFPEKRADIRIKVKDGDVTLVGALNKIHSRRLETALSQIRELPSVDSVSNEVRLVDN